MFLLQVLENVFSVFAIVMLIVGVLIVISVIAIAVFVIVSVVVFQSTHPLRDATFKFTEKDFEDIISIHAPLTGCDKLMFEMLLEGVDFNPRTPYGMRR